MTCAVVKLSNTKDLTAERYLDPTFPLADYSFWHDKKYRENVRKKLKQSGFNLKYKIEERSKDGANVPSKSEYWVNGKDECIAFHNFGTGTHSIWTYSDWEHKRPHAGHFEEFVYKRVQLDEWIENHKTA